MYNNDDFFQLLMQRAGMPTYGQQAGGMPQNLPPRMPMGDMSSFSGAMTNMAMGQGQSGQPVQAMPQGDPMLPSRLPQGIDPSNQFIAQGMATQRPPQGAGQMPGQAVQGTPPPERQQHQQMPPAGYQQRPTGLLSGNLTQQGRSPFNLMTLDQAREQIRKLGG